MGGRAADGRRREETGGSVSSGPGEGSCTRPADPGIRRLLGPVQRPSLVSLSPRRGAGQGDEGAAEAAPTGPRFLTPLACRLKKLSEPRTRGTAAAEVLQAYASTDQGPVLWRCRESGRSWGRKARWGCREACRGSL